MTTQLTADEASTLRVMIMLRMVELWKWRNKPHWRAELKTAVAILRKLRAL